MTIEKTLLPQEEPLVWDDELIESVVQAAQEVDEWHTARLRERRELLVNAEQLNDEGVKAYRSAHYDEGEPLLMQALEIRRRVVGEEHPDFATSCNNLAGLYENTARYEEAGPLFEQALEIWQQALSDLKATLAI